MSLGGSANLSSTDSDSAVKARPVVRMAARRAGDTWLLHPAGFLDQRSWVYAAGLARDPFYTLAVVDVPGNASPGFLHDLARVLPADDTGLRLVFGRTPPGGTAHAGQWLAARSGRVVVAALGRPRPTAEGALFIGADRGQGWIRYDPAGGASFEGRRFPHPEWDHDLPAEPFGVTERTMAEPVPAGLWLRPARTTHLSERHRAFVTTRLRSRLDAISVVVGEPGADPVALADVARLHSSLPEHLRHSVRFISFGSVAPLADMPFGPALAAEIGMPVHVYNGLPVGNGSAAEAGGDVVIVGPDGVCGRPMMASETEFFPPFATGERRRPEVTAHHWPLSALPLLGPGVHRYGPDAVIEVVLSGLWVRSPQDQAVMAPRFAPVDERHELVMYSDVETRLRGEFRRIAESLAREVRTQRGIAVQVRAIGPKGRLKRPLEAAVEVYAPPLAAPGPDGVTARTARTRRGPAVDHREVAKLDGTLRAAIDRQYEEAVAFASALLRRQPALLGSGEPSDAIRELAMLRLYLLDGEDHLGLPAHLRSDPPAQEPLQGFIAGLNRLPSFAGPVALRASLTDAELSWYEKHDSVVARRCFATTFFGTAGQHGNTDFATLSVEGRRTAVLEAGDPDVVLFPSATSFAVLQVRRGARGQRNAVFLRELRSPNHWPATETDRSALRRLEMALAHWQRDEILGPRRTGGPGWLFQPPGLVSRDAVRGTWGCPDR